MDSFDLRAYSIQVILIHLSTLINFVDLHPFIALILIHSISFDPLSFNLFDLHLSLEMIRESNQFVYEDQINAFISTLEMIHSHQFI